jgi:hypothetical protein
MKKHAIATLLTLAAVATFAYAGDGWTEITSNNNRERVYSIKEQSVKIDKNNRGTIIVVGTGRVVNTVKRTSEVSRWYVSLQDCDNEMGMLTMLETDGSFISDTAFVFNQGSVGATIAETLCMVYKQIAKENTPTKGKSI